MRTALFASLAVLGNAAAAEGMAEAVKESLSAAGSSFVKRAAHLGSQSESMQKAISNAVVKNAIGAKDGAFKSVANLSGLAKQTADLAHKPADLLKQSADKVAKVFHEETKEIKKTADTLKDAEKFFRESATETPEKVLKAHRKKSSQYSSDESSDAQTLESETAPDSDDGEVEKKEAVKDIKKKKVVKSKKPRSLDTLYTSSLDNLEANNIEANAPAPGGAFKPYFRPYVMVPEAAAPFQEHFIPIVTSPGENRNVYTEKFEPLPETPVERSIVDDCGKIEDETAAENFVINNGVAELLPGARINAANLQFSGIKELGKKSGKSEDSTDAKHEKKGKNDGKKISKDSDEEASGEANEDEPLIFTGVNKRVGRVVVPAKSKALEKYDEEKQQLFDELHRAEQAYLKFVQAQNQRVAAVTTQQQEKSKKAIMDAGKALNDKKLQVQQKLAEAAQKSLARQEKQDQDIHKKAVDFQKKREEELQALKEATEQELEKKAQENDKKFKAAEQRAQEKRKESINKLRRRI